MPINIHKASINDVQQIHQLAHAIWPTTYAHILSQAQLQYMLQKIYAVDILIHEIANNAATYYIAYNENEMAIGFVSIGHIDNSTIKLHKIYVLPFTQGKGLGKKLLQYCITVAKEKAYTNMILNVNRQNTALAFYEAFGFIIIDEVDIEIGHGYYMNDYIMQYKW
jgi:diamine N-acetyltransferase